MSEPTDAQLVDFLNIMADLHDVEWLAIAAQRLESKGEISLAEEAIGACRRLCEEGLGFNCTFVDDSAKVLVVLAQRAVLAGLDADCQDDMKRRFKAAAEPHRAGHERALGFRLQAKGEISEEKLALKDIYLIATATAQDFALLERWWVESRRGSNANRAYKNLVERVREIAKIAGKESTP